MKAFAYEGYDFEISSTDAFRVQYSDTDPVTVSVTFTKDDVALEFNELTTLVLESVGTNVVLTGEGVFFRNELDIIIVDSDGTLLVKTLHNNVILIIEINHYALFV